jgi:hypothetical protein
MHKVLLLVHLFQDQEAVVEVQTLTTVVLVVAE